MTDTNPEHREWQWSALEFDVLWRAVGRDRLPYPVQYVGDAVTADEDRRDRAAAAQRLHTLLDDTLHDALATLANPEVRVEVCGFRGTDPSAMTRIHAAIRGDTAVVVRQSPGTDLHRGSDVHVTSMPAHRVASTIAGALPPQARGTGRPVAGRRRDGVLRSVDVGGDDLDCFLTRPRAGVGEIGIHPGPAFDWRPEAGGTVLHWVDVVDDGRYLVIGEEAAEPAGTDETAARLRDLIGRVAAGQANTTSHTAT